MNSTAKICSSALGGTADDRPKFGVARREVLQLHGKARLAFAGMYDDALRDNERSHSGMAGPTIGISARRALKN
jgi:hypothetical protein